MGCCWDTESVKFESEMKTKQKEMELEIEREKQTQIKEEREYEERRRKEEREYELNKLQLIKESKEKEIELNKREKDIQERENQLKNLNVDFLQTFVKDNRYQIKKYEGKYNSENNTFTGQMKQYEGNLKNNRIILPDETYMYRQLNENNYYSNGRRLLGQKYGY